MPNLLMGFATTFIPQWARPPLRAVYYPIYRVFVRISCWANRIWDRITPNPSQTFPIPPPLFRFKVGGTCSRSAFLDTGQKCAQSLAEAMQSAGRSLAAQDIECVLDFGCGCARILRWLARQFPEKRYIGVDVDTEMIAWCRNNFPSAEFTVNSPIPPLPYPDREFDLIYASSVFTHLGEAAQLHWLAEFQRLVSRRGVLLATVHGEAVWQGLPSHQKSQIRSQGILTTVSRKLETFFPDWYQTTFHSEAYVRTTFSRYFGSVYYLKEGMGYLDVVLCQDPQPKQQPEV